MSRRRATAAQDPTTTRPKPPPELSEQLLGMRFKPAPEVLEWIRSQILDESGHLHNEDHGHLADASIGVLWASSGYVKQQRRVVGMTEDMRLGARGHPWLQARAEQQLAEWFGAPPDFLITLDAFHCAECDDVEFCALVDHELYHIGHRRDEFGNPAFDKTGRPKLGIRGHDVEEFTGVVRRYGVAEGTPLAEMIIAAAKGAQVSPLRISQACGTCALRLAA